MPRKAKSLLLLTISSLIWSNLLFLPKLANANDDFYVTAETWYELKSDFTVSARTEVGIKNLTSEKYAPSFEFSLDGVGESNLKVYEDNLLTPFTLENNNNKSKVIVSFKKPIAGKDKIKTLNFTYSSDDFSKVIGNTKEITLPISFGTETVNNSNIYVFVDKEHGEPSYVSPNFSSHEEKENGYYYSFENIDINISMGLGEYEVYAFTLEYHLHNDTNNQKEYEIALPPDTSTQKVYLDSISPQPLKVFVDNDGNWIGKYILDKNKRLDIKTAGHIKVYATPVNNDYFLADSFNTYLKEDTYWSTNNAAISQLANDLDSMEDIYNFVTKSLSYNFDRSKQNPERLGSTGVLNQPELAICTEFSDLFVTLARAKGVPARQLNGYAYSQNPQVQPLSLVADVLHSWADYWSIEEKNWIPVDPTWGNTTNGTDYFHNLDFRHIVFSIHGTSSTYPLPAGSYKLGDNPQKDVFVSIGKLPEYEKDISISLLRPSNMIGAQNIEVKNNSAYAIYNSEVSLIQNGKLIDSKIIKVIPPFGEEIFKPSLLGLKNGVPSKVDYAGVSQDIVFNYNYSMYIFSSLILLVLMGVLYTGHKVFNKKRRLPLDETY